MTTPLPITSMGFCLIHGRTGLGSRIWLNTQPFEGEFMSTRLRAAFGCLSYVIASLQATWP